MLHHPSLITAITRLERVERERRLEQDADVARAFNLNRVKPTPRFRPAIHRMGRALRERLTGVAPRAARPSIAECPTECC